MRASLDALVISAREQGILPAKGESPLDAYQGQFQYIFATNVRTPLRDMILALGAEPDATKRQEYLGQIVQFVDEVGTGQAGVFGTGDMASARATLLMLGNYVALTGDTQSVSAWYEYGISDGVTAGMPADTAYGMIFSAALAVERDPSLLTAYGMDQQTYLQYLITSLGLPPETGFEAVMAADVYHAAESGTPPIAVPAVPPSPEALPITRASVAAWITTPAIAPVYDRQSQNPENPVVRAGVFYGQNPMIDWGQAMASAHVATGGFNPLTSRFWGQPAESGVLVQAASITPRYRPDLPEGVEGAGPLYDAYNPRFRPQVWEVMSIVQVEDPFSDTHGAVLRPGAVAPFLPTGGEPLYLYDTNMPPDGTAGEGLARTDTGNDGFGLDNLNELFPAGREQYWPQVILYQNDVTPDGQLFREGMDGAADMYSAVSGQNGYLIDTPEKFNAYMAFLQGGPDALPPQGFEPLPPIIPIGLFATEGDRVVNDFAKLTRFNDRIYTSNMTGEPMTMDQMLADIPNGCKIAAGGIIAMVAQRDEGGNILHDEHGNIVLREDAAAIMANMTAMGYSWGCQKSIGTYELAMAIMQEQCVMPDGSRPDTAQIFGQSNVVIIGSASLPVADAPYNTYAVINSQDNLVGELCGIDNPELADVAGTEGYEHFHPVMVNFGPPPGTLTDNGAMHGHGLDHYLDAVTTEQPIVLTRSLVNGEVGYTNTRDLWESGEAAPTYTVNQILESGSPELIAALARTLMPEEIGSVFSALSAEQVTQLLGSPEFLNNLPTMTRDTLMNEHFEGWAVGRGYQGVREMVSDVVMDPVNGFGREGMIELLIGQPPVGGDSYMAEVLAEALNANPAQAFAFFSALPAEQHLALLENPVVMQNLDAPALGNILGGYYQMLATNPNLGFTLDDGTGRSAYDVILNTYDDLIRAGREQGLTTIVLDDGSVLQADALIAQRDVLNQARLEAMAVDGIDNAERALIAEDEGLQAAALQVINIPGMDGVVAALQQSGIQIQGDALTVAAAPTAVVAQPVETGPESPAL
ncbi:hypothetical protein GC177_01060 [bacterium]|nr:hypothetical protein [bacterium]